MMCIGRIEISIVRLILATNAAAFAKEPGWVMMYGMGKQGDNIGGEDINLADDVDWENGDDKGYPEDDPAQGAAYIDRRVGTWLSHLWHYSDCKCQDATPEEQDSCAVMC